MWHIEEKTALASGICDSVGDTVLSKPVQNQCPCSVSGTIYLLLALSFRWDVKPKSRTLAVMAGSTVNWNRRQEIVPASKFDLLINKWNGKRRMTGGHGCLSLLHVVHGSSVRGIPQLHTWQPPCIPLLPSAVGINRLHSASKKGSGIFSLMEDVEQHLLVLDSSCQFCGVQDEGFLLLSTESSKCSN